jgi:hypothetical protein
MLARHQKDGLSFSLVRRYCHTKSHKSHFVKSAVHSAEVTSLPQTFLSSDLFWNRQFIADQ